MGLPCEKARTFDGLLAFDGFAEWLGDLIDRFLDSLATCSADVCFPALSLRSEISTLVCFHPALSTLTDAVVVPLPGGVALWPADGYVVAQDVRGMQERSAAARGQEMHVEFVGVIAIVVMPVAGNDCADAGATIAGYGCDLEEVFLFVFALQIGDEP